MHYWCITKNVLSFGMLISSICKRTIAMFHSWGHLNEHVKKVPQEIYTKKKPAAPLRPVVGCVLWSKHKMNEHYHHVKMQNDLKIHHLKITSIEWRDYNRCLFSFFTVCPQKKEKFSWNVKISFWVSREIDGRAVTQASHQSCCFKHKMSAVNILLYKNVTLISLTDPNWLTLHIMFTEQTNTIFFFH